MLWRRSVCPNASFYSLTSMSLWLEPKFRRTIVSTSRTCLLPSADSSSPLPLELKRCKRRYPPRRYLALLVELFSLWRPSELPRASKLQSMPFSKLGSMWNYCLLIGLGFGSSTLFFLGGVLDFYLSVIFLTYMQGLRTFCLWSAGSIWAVLSLFNFMCTRR